MATQLQIRRGTTAQMNAFTGAEGELAVNTSTDTVHVHDGATAGGFALAKADGSNIATYAGSFTTLAASGAVTLSSTLAVTGEITANGGIALGDNDKATFGASDDLQIYSDGDSSYLKENSATGSLFVDGDNIRFRTSDGSKSYALFTNSGSARLYHDNSIKIETTSTGIDVTGNMIANGVGIGTSSPEKPLHVNSGAGNIGVRVESSDATASIEFMDSGTTSTATSARVGGISNDFFVQTNGLERMRIDGATGNLLVGKTALEYENTAGHIFRNDGLQSSIRSGGNVADFNRLSSDGEVIRLSKDGTTVGSLLTSGGRFAFINTKGGVSAGFDFEGNTKALRPVNGNGTSSDNTHDIGRADVRWKDIRATNGTIQTSDRNEKQDIETLSDAEQRVAVAAKGLMRKFRWIDAVETKGDNARIHFGIIAQDLQDAFTAEGLNAGRYAMFISDTWWETQTEVAAVEAVEATEDTEAIEAVDAYTRTDTYDTAEEAPEGATERTRLGIRYSELLAFIIAAI